MRVKAAVLYGQGTKYQIEDIELDPPRENEVLIKFAATGLCHSDEHLVTGDMVADPSRGSTWKQFPMIAGHEGAGVVEEVGPGVTSVRPGDHVVTSFVPSCGVCPSCSSGHQNLCDLGATLTVGRQADGTSRHHTRGGEDCGTMCALGTFAEYSVVRTASVITIPDYLPLDKAALVACGVTTGWGSAVYAANVQPGETVVVIGTGGVGMNAVQGAALAGARFVVAVDTAEFKRNQAPAFGATHTAATIADAAGLVREITWGRMADKAILTVGLAEGAMIAPMMSLVKKGGRAVVTAVANMYVGPPCGVIQPRGSGHPCAYGGSCPTNDFDGNTIRLLPAGTRSWTGREEELSLCCGRCCSRRSTGLPSPRPTRTTWDP